MGIPFVDLQAQLSGIRAEVMSAITAVVEASSFIGGEHVRSFEADFAAWLGVAHCVGVGNGTDALYLALRASGIGPGDEVITVANSFIATSEAIAMAGARVVFVDCDPATYTLDVGAFEAAVTPRTRAVIPVHLYGRPADMDAVMAVANRHGLLVVEDAAQAHGAELGGRRVGTIGHAGCFSFYPGKNLGAYGDAGCVVTNDSELAARIRMTANHGRSDKYDHRFEAVNSRLDALQAAVLSVKLRHIDAWTAGRRAAAAQYNRLLAGSELPLPGDPPGGRHVYHLYVTRVPERARVQARLAEDRIATGVHYPIALPNLTAYAHLGHRASDFPWASRYQDEVISLPMFGELRTDQVERVAERLLAVLAELRQ